jgi:hypothetical protein
LVVLARKGRKAFQELKAFKGRKGHKESQDRWGQLVHKALREHKVTLAQPARLGALASKVRPVQQAHRVCKGRLAQPELPVRKDQLVIPDHRDQLV